jgi:phage shock protein C
MNERLYRSVDDRVIAGVCGGLAARFAVDPSLVRIAYAVVALITGIFPLLVLYVIMAAVVPEEPTGFAGRSPTPPDPDAMPGWNAPGDSAGAAGAGFAGAPTAGDVTGTSQLEPGASPAAWASPPAAWASPPGASDAPPSGPEGGRRARRRNDRTAAMIGGVVLVALGVYFLVRDRLAIDWGIVWAAGLMALGVVIVIAAFRPRR